MTQLLSRRAKGRTQDAEAEETPEQRAANREAASAEASAALAKATQEQVRGSTYIRGFSDPQRPCSDSQLCHQGMAETCKAAEASQF